jgi:hypothetical protein
LCPGIVTIIAAAAATIPAIASSTNACTKDVQKIMPLYYFRKKMMIQKRMSLSSRIVKHNMHVI